MKSKIIVEKKIKLSDIYNFFSNPFVNSDCYITGISHLKRNIKPGTVFFALKTNGLDSYTSVETAIAKKVAVIVTEKAIEDYPCIIVPDSYKAFIELCHYYRSLLDITVVAITGSIGKTSTKDMLSCILNESFVVSSSKKNANSSHLAAMNIYDVECDTEVFVQEVAIKKIHDSSIALNPNYSVITNIGYSHAEEFGSREEILNEKLKITDGMKLGSTLFLNGDDDLLWTYSKNNGDSYKGINIITYGIENKNSDFTAENLVKDDVGYEFDIRHKSEIYHARVDALGRHNVLNAVVAFAIGMSLKMPAEKIISGMLCWKPSGYRQNIFERNGVSVLADCFNASPDSVKGAVDTLCNINVTGRHIAVLADMLEMGRYSKKLHEDIGKYLLDKNIDTVIFYGAEVKYTYNQICNSKINCYYTCHRQELLQYLTLNIHSGDAVLFKGSHGMGLENIIDKLFDTNFTDYSSYNQYIWLRLKIEGCNFIDYFSFCGYKKIAVYGLTVIGNELISTLIQESIHVDYAIDDRIKYAPNILYPIEVVPINDLYNPVDLIIVCYDDDYDQIKLEISKKICTNVIKYDDFADDIITYMNKSGEKNEI